MKKSSGVLWVMCAAVLLLGCHAETKQTQPVTTGTLIVDLCSEDRYYVLLGNKNTVDLKASSQDVLETIAQRAQSTGLKYINIRSECKLPDSQVCAYAKPFLSAGIDVASLWLPTAIGDGMTLTMLATRCP